MQIFVLMHKISMDKHGINTLPRLLIDVIGAANAVIRWVRKEESKQFLGDAPVFQNACYLRLKVLC